MPICTVDRKKKPVFDIKNFSKFKEKIIYILVDKLPEGLHDTSKIEDLDEKGNRIIDNTLMIEHAQRNSIAKGLVDADDNDLIIVSDVDEIPNLEKNDLQKNTKRLIHFKQKMKYILVRIYTGNKFANKFTLILL